MNPDAQYEIVRKVGEGAYGMVYLAKDRHLSRAVALKVFKFMGAHPDSLERFRREAVLLTHHPHECIVPVLDAGLDHHPPYMVFGWMAGGDLKQRIREKGAASPREVARVGVRIARALAHLHGRDILHRDVKPANVLLDAEGEAFLADLGLGLPPDAPRLTQTQAVVGTPTYMASELLEGKPYSPQSDVFALGALLLEYALGRVVTDAHSDVKKTQGRLREVRDRALRTALRRCLASAPERRPRSATDLAEELEVIANRDSSRSQNVPLPGGGATMELARLPEESSLSNEAASARSIRIETSWRAAVAVGGVLVALAFVTGAVFGGLGRWAWPRIRPGTGSLASAETARWQRPPLGPPARPAEALAIDDRGRLVRPEGSPPEVEGTPAGARAVAVRADGAGGVYVVFLLPDASLRIERRRAASPGEVIWGHEHRPGPAGRTELAFLLIDSAGAVAVLDSEDDLDGPSHRTLLLWAADGRVLFHRTLAGTAPRRRLVPLALRPGSLDLVVEEALVMVDRATGATSWFQLDAFTPPVVVATAGAGLVVRDAGAHHWALP